MQSPERAVASLTIRDVPADVKRTLAERAARAGTSLEAFLRSLLAREAAAAAERETFSAWHARVIAGDGLSDDTHEAFLAAVEEGRQAHDAEGRDPFAEWRE